jgi:hypothetical protein
LGIAIRNDYFEFKGVYSLHEVTGQVNQGYTVFSSTAIFSYQSHWAEINGCVERTTGLLVQTNFSREVISLIYLLSLLKKVEPPIFSNKIFLYLHLILKNNCLNHEKLRDGIHFKSRFV